MKREEVMEMAYESGMIAGYEGEPDLLERFAALVAAAERERIIAQNAPEIEKINEHIKALEEARKAEREACAKVCDARYMGDNNREDMEARRCAAAIRARGNT
jgi:hypothetical protein